MVVLKDLKAKSIIREVKKLVENSTCSLTSGYTSYTKFKVKIVRHNIVVAPNNTKVEKVFPWINIPINNTK